MRTDGGPDVILFDLGGVLVEWDGIEPLMRLSGGRLSREDARRFWLVSPWVRRFEKGACGPREFADGVIRELELPIPPGELLEEFVSWDRGPLPGAVELLDALRGRFLLACLTNQNELHWGLLRDKHRFAERFDRCYASHEIRQVKPDPPAFLHAISDLRRRPESILFLDDNPECVEAARRLGLRAHRVAKVQGARELLEDLGILPRAG